MVEFWKRPLEWWHVFCRLKTTCALEPDSGAVGADETPVEAAAKLINAMMFGDGFSLTL